MNSVFKKCNKCFNNKTTDNFFKRKKSPDGLEYTCKQCKSFYDKKYKKNNQEKITNYISNNKEKIITYSKEYHKNNKEKINNYHKEHYNKYNYQKQWKENNKSKLSIKHKEKYHSDPNIKIRQNVGNRIRAALKKYNTTLLPTKSRTQDLLGCKINNLKTHLENQFLPEMNWENHGIIWEIDHIIPCSTFDLTKIEEQQKCFHYSNLQPLFKTSQIAESLGYLSQIGNRNKTNKIF